MVIYGRVKPFKCRRFTIICTCLALSLPLVARAESELPCLPAATLNRAGVEVRSAAGSPLWHMRCYGSEQTCKATRGNVALTFGRQDSISISVSGDVTVSRQHANQRHIIGQTPLPHLRPSDMHGVLWDDQALVLETERAIVDRIEAHEVRAVLRLLFCAAHQPLHASAVHAGMERQVESLFRRYWIKDDASPIDGQGGATVVPAQTIPVRKPQSEFARYAQIIAGPPGSASLP